MQQQVCIQYKYLKQGSLLNILLVFVKAIEKMLILLRITYKTDVSLAGPTSLFYV